MKIISTTIFRLSILSLFFSLAFSSSAEEYKSMIRYDRVWECVSSRWFVNSVNYMKFDGTEEINGKTYHRLVTFKKAGFDFSDDPKHHVYLYDELDDIYEPEGYIREEDGIVYTLISHNVFEDSEDWYGRRYISAENDPEFPYVSEEIIYNFNCKEGDYYNCMTYQMGNAVKESFTVGSIGTVEIAGEQCRLFNISNKYGLEFTIIEGIGAAIEGCLNYHEFLESPTFPYAYHVLNRVFDNIGNVIYASEDYWGDIPYGNVSGINSISVQSFHNAPIYDMLGRRLTSPAPGQLYIQDGKKFVGH